MRTIALLTSLLLCSAAASAAALTLEQAKKVAARTMAYAAAKGWKVSVAVVNAEGNLMLFERADGSYAGSIGASQAKAVSSAKFQRPTSAFVEAIKAGRTGILSIEGIVAVDGGVPVSVDGAFAGAVGVSGATAAEDDEAANDGAKALSK